MTPPTQTGRPPWAIEIRDPVPPAPPAPDPAPPRRGPGRRLLALVVLGIACFAATVALLGVLLGDDADPPEASAPPTTTPITFAPRDQTTTTVSSAPSTTAPPETTTTTVPTTTTAPPTTAAPSTGSVPSLSPSFGGGWVALLTSVPYSAGEARLDAAYQEVRGFAPGARAARAEDWASLTDGFWVLVEPGPFASEADARSFCAGVDTARSDCAPRQLRRG